MAETVESGAISDADKRKAKAFFDRGVTVAGTGNWDFAIEMFLQALNIDPNEIEAHKQLREISLKRKATGGKPIGMFAAMSLKRPSKDDKQNLLNSEKLLANDPGNTDHMVGILQSAYRAGYIETAMWIGPILLRANADSGKPDFNKFIILKDVYKGMNEWKLATDACHHAAAMRPDDMDLGTELKHLAAQDTIKGGNYGGSGNFTESVRDMAGQKKLMDADTDVRSHERMSGVIGDAKAAYDANPQDLATMMKYVDALIKNDSADSENVAIDVLQDAYDRTKQFRYRLNIGQIVMRQLARTERTLRAQVVANPADETLKKDYEVFAKEKNEKELEEFMLAAENYPTDLKYKFESAVRLFLLERYGEAIPIFQDARRDPKHKVDATVALGRSFMEAGFAEEAVDTLKGALEDYQLKGDEKSTNMTYWYGRALEMRKDFPAAIKQYSQVAQWKFNYRDVQARIKRLRASA